MEDDLAAAVEKGSNDAKRAAAGKLMMNMPWEPGEDDDNAPTDAVGGFNATIIYKKSGQGLKAENFAIIKLLDCWAQNKTNSHHELVTKETREGVEDVEGVSLMLDLKAPPDETNPEKEIDESPDGDWDPGNPTVGQELMTLCQKAGVVITPVLKVGSTRTEKEETPRFQMDGSLSDSKTIPGKKYYEVAGAEGRCYEQGCGKVEISWEHRLGSPKFPAKVRGFAT